MRFRIAFLSLFALLLAVPAAGQEISEAPEVILRGVPFEIEVLGGGEESVWFEVRTATGEVLGGGTVTPNATASTRDLLVSDGSALPLTVLIGSESFTVDPTLTSGWYSIIPPLVAIILALLIREVVTALFVGVWLGALAVGGFNPIAGTARFIDQFVVPAVADSDHASIMVFTLLLGAMVGLISRNGGTRGIVDAVAPFASTSRRGKLATWGAGMAIFFDDYANTLIVGNTMRPITDRLKISREKLAYLVDSTAAPVAALVPVSTWVGYEISLIGDGFAIAAEQTPAAAAALDVSSFTIFIESIPYLFYPLLAIVLVFLTSVMGRDFGPMASAEQRAASGEGLYRTGANLAVDTEAEDMSPKEGAPRLWFNAAIPVLTVIIVVLIGLYASGRAAVGPEASLRDIFGEAASYKALLWGSLAGTLMAVFLSLGQRILTLRECIDGAVGGFRAMMLAMVILVLAWSMGSVTEAIGTSSFLALLLSDRVAIELIPVIVFVTSGAMAFATGTSWGTMAIMLPVVIPLTVALGGPDILPGGPAEGILLGGIASVLAGAIFGDHCSPISDTTVLSSTASACDHVDHVKTQLPYALVVGILGMVLGNIGTAYGLPPFAALGIGVVVLIVIVRFVGRTVEDTTAPAG
jgi:Na+/H+ antiporter NhaC